MIVKFLSDLVEEKEYYKRWSGLKVKDFYRIQGHNLIEGRDATIVVDNNLRLIQRYFIDEEKYSCDSLSRVCIHELIHFVGDWHPDEIDGLVYESPLDYVVDLMIDMLED